MCNSRQEVFGNVPDRHRYTDSRRDDEDKDRVGEVEMEVQQERGRTMSRREMSRREGSRTSGMYTYGEEGGGVSENGGSGSEDLDDEEYMPSSTDDEEYESEESDFAPSLSRELPSTSAKRRRSSLRDMVQLIEQEAAQRRKRVRR